MWIDSQNNLYIGDCRPGDREATQEEIIKFMKKPSYVELRQREYPPIADYIDAIVKNDESQRQAYIDACLKVKATYPKP